MNKKKTIGSLKKGDKLYGINIEDNTFVVAEFVEFREIDEYVSFYIVSIDGNEYGDTDTYSQMETLLCKPMLDRSHRDNSKETLKLFTTLDRLLGYKMRLLSYYQAQVDQAQKQIDTIKQNNKL